MILFFSYQKNFWQDRKEPFLIFFEKEKASFSFEGERGEFNGL